MHESYFHDLLFFPQVMKVKVELIAHLAKNAKFTRTSAECCLNDLVDKVGDVKNGKGVQEALSCIAEAVGLEFVSLQVRVSYFIRNSFEIVSLHICINIDETFD